MNTTLKTIAVTAIAALSLTATAKVTNGASYGDWKGACEGNECGVIQVANDEKGKPVAQIVIRKVKEIDNVPTLFVTVPLGVNLLTGMGFFVDGKELGVVPYEFCSENGCNAAVPVGGKELEAIKKGNVLQLATYVEDKQKTMNFSLKGVTAAINAL